MAKDKVIVIRGKLDWAKVIGDARPHTGNPKYDKGPYWSVDVTPLDMSIIKEFGIEEKLREPNRKNEKEHRTEPFLSLRVLENRSDGKKNEAPKIVDIQGKPWDGRLIGNGTVADVKVKIVDYGRGVEKGVYLQAIRVLEHVPYQTEDFKPLSEDDEYFAAPESTSEDTESTAADIDEDDDIPF